MSIKSRLTKIALLTILLAAFAAGAAEPEGYTFSLFNGRDLAGWDVTNCEVAVEDGALVLKAGNGLVRSNLEFGDFVLELDWRARNPDAYDSGIFVRANFPSEKKGRAWPDRYQINLKRGEDGNLVGVKDAVSTGLAKPGEWNHFKITCVGPKIELEINGKPAWKHDGLKADRGFIGLQSEVPAGGQFEFKNIRVTELGFRSLFNGKDLAGWQGATDGYTVEDGTLVAQKRGSGNLFTTDEFSDFVFRFDFKLEQGSNNGLGIRAPLRGDIAYSGMELQILDDPAPEYRQIQSYQHHGSVYGIVPAKPGHLKPTGEWNSQEVICRGRHIAVNLNGTTIVDANLDEATANGTIDGKDHPGVKRDRGHLGFLGHGTRVEFRNLRIKPLSAVAK
jgi:hypothetical protein